MAKLKIFYKKVMYFKGADLAAAREAAGLSQTELAERCGWTQQYQSRLDIPIGHAIDEEKVEVIERGLGIR